MNVVFKKTPHFRGIAMALCLLLATWSTLLSQTGPVPPGNSSHSGENDPDVPAFLNGRIEKADYLLKRDEHINMIRGLSDPQAGVKRTNAIRTMERQTISKRSSISSTGWTPIGPYPIPNGQTNGTQVAVSGRVTCIAVHPTDPNIVYVGTAQGGVYRSLNGGTTWTAIFDNAQSLSIGSIAIAPSSTTTVYVGTGEPNQSADCFFGVGVYRIDNAETTADLVGPINPVFTFTATNGTVYSPNCFTGRSISKILVAPSDPATIFVATTTGVSGMGNNGLSGFIPPLGIVGLYRSTNATSAAGSVTFTKLAPTTAGSLDMSPATGSRRITDMVFDPTSDGSTLLCATLGTSTAGDGGIFRSTNALAATPTFSQTLSLGTGSSGYVTTFAINSVGGIVTVLCATGPSNGTVRKSTDGGQSWSSALSAVTGFCGTQCVYDAVVAIDPTDANIMLVGGSTNGTSTVLVKKSTDGGTTWTGSDANLHADVHAIVFAPSNHNIIYTGNDGGIFKSTDAGANWTSLNNSGFSATQFMSIAVHPTDPNFTIGGTQDNGTEYLNSDKTWTRADYGDGGYALIDQSATNTSNVTMYHTYFNKTNSLIGFGRVTSSTCATEDEWVFRGAGSVSATTGCEGVAKGANNGIVVSNTVQFYAPMALGPGTPNTLYFGTDRLYRSTDRGESMSIVSQGPLASSIPISAIGISKQNDSVRIVGLQNGKVFATRTASTTLTDITSTAFPTNPTGSSTNRYISRAVIDPNNSQRAYITFSFYTTAGKGIWRTDTLTSSTAWQAVASGIPDVPVNSFVIDPYNSNNLFAGTDIGVYYSTDAGANWSPYSSGLPRVAVFDMAITSGHRLRIATHGRGMWEDSEAPLPIQLATFDAHFVQGTSVSLNWSTVSEVNNYGFYVERRAENSAGFAAVSEFIPGAGTSLDQHEYSWTDQALAPGVYFYRLRQVDLNGDVVYSNDITVVMADPLAVGEENMPKVYALAQNYPNPFNPSTTIRYALPKESFVTLRVYNMLGQEVATLINQREDAGFKSVKFDMANLPSGIYIYRLNALQISGDQTASFTDVKKMLLVR